MANKKSLVFGVSQALVVGALTMGAGCKSGGEAPGPERPVVNPGPCMPGQDPAKDNCYEDKAAQPAQPDAAPDLEAAPEPINVNPGPDELPEPAELPEPIGPVRINTQPTLELPDMPIDAAPDAAPDMERKEIKKINVNTGPSRIKPLPKAPPDIKVNPGPAQD